MGGCVLANHREIKVATLNYSGILKSPFEFYSIECEDQQITLGQIFESLMAKNQDTRGPNFKWELGDIDQKMQEKRYTPIYRKGAGVINGRIISREQFIAKWEEQFDKNAPSVENLTFCQAQRAMTLIFDLMCMETFLMYVYHASSYQEAAKNAPLSYLTFTENSFNKSFINQQLKMKKTLAAIERNHLDIIFLQETNDPLIEALMELQKAGKFIIKDLPQNESTIIVRKALVRQKTEDTQEMLERLSLGQKERMNWNDDTVMMFIDDLILISSHISSKKAKNQKQMDGVYRDLALLAQTYPDRKIIVGFDANTSKIQLDKGSKEISQNFHMIPSQIGDITTCKKRTKIQAQRHKANVLASKRSDYIITNAKIVGSRVSTIEDREIKEDQELLPSEQHPFDHFIVRANLEI